MQATLSEIRPDLLLVQGDTRTVFASALAAFYLKVPIGHVEASLRSHDIYNPFPEESNRRLTSQLTEASSTNAAGSPRAAEGRCISRKNCRYR
jgi:UDP-N-acetylglucosamine 2-epimerase (non-hydrolysing)